MTDDILMDRIFKYFDTLNNGLISREEWIMGLNIFLRGWWARVQVPRDRGGTHPLLLHHLRPQR